MSSEVPNLKRFRANLGGRARTRRERSLDAYIIGTKLDSMIIRAALDGDIHTLPDDLEDADQIRKWLLDRPSR